MKEYDSNINKNEKEFTNAEQEIQKQYHEDVARRMGKRSIETSKQQTSSSDSGEYFKGLVGSLIDDISSEIMPQSHENEYSEREKIAQEKMQELITHNFVSACRETKRLQDLQSGYHAVLNSIKDNSSKNTVSNRTKITDGIIKRISDLENSTTELAQSNPEAYTAIHGMELRKNIQNRDHGLMIETAYVEENLQRLEENMREGQPTFIHGHLGSGKTELAITAAKDFMISRAAEKEAKIGYEKYCQEHPEAKDEEAVQRLGIFYNRAHETLNRRLADGDKAATESLTPLIISGSSDTDASDLFVDKTLKLTKYNGTDTAGHKQQYDEAWKEYRDSRQPEYEKLSEDERKEQEAKDSAQFFDLYVAKHQAFGTEVEEITKPLLQAIEQGRPIIFDEVNAVPTAILISLNDLLNRHPGQTCYVPGRGQVRIQDGFSITMTGNLSSNSVEYGGTNDLNPALLSRLDIFEYTYLPQNDKGALSEQQDMSKNQLFQVMMTYLTDRQGNLELPEINENVDKLFRLAQFAHQTQQIFAGKHTESAVYDDSGDGLDVEFKKSVLSVRGIMKILKTWNKGEKMDLDKALWEGFIKNATDAGEQHAFLKLANNFGFFSEKDGWKINDIQGGGRALLGFEDIHPGKYNYQPSPFEYYTMQDTVDLIYGDRPERQEYPNFSFEDLPPDEVLDEVTSEEYEGFEKTKEEIQDAINALEVLAEQCGCLKR